LKRAKKMWVYMCRGVDIIIIGRAREREPKCRRAWSGGASSSLRSRKVCVDRVPISVGPPRVALPPPPSSRLSSRSCVVDCVSPSPSPSPLLSSLSTRSTQSIQNSNVDHLNSNDCCCCSFSSPARSSSRTSPTRSRGPCGRGGVATGPSCGWGSPSSVFFRVPSLSLPERPTSSFVVFVFLLPSDCHRRLDNLNHHDHHPPFKGSITVHTHASRITK
jgi:hypothetical protein